MGRPKKYDNDWPSVTEIVDIIDKPGLRYWYGKYGTSHCEQQKKESQKIGHIVHKGIELYLKNKPLPKSFVNRLTDQHKKMIELGINWCKETNIVPFLMETPIKSDLFQFNGTPDLITKDLTLIDWKTDSVPKTSKEDYERTIKYMWQIGGYAIAFEEMYKQQIKDAYIIRISKDFQLNKVHFLDMNLAKKEFLKLREVFKLLKCK